MPWLFDQVVDAQQKRLRNCEAKSFCYPVMLPPGLARLATSPLLTGSIATANTMGMVDVACLTVGTALPTVTMTST